MDTLFFSKSKTFEFKSLIFFSISLSLSVKISELKFEIFLLLVTKSFLRFSISCLISFLKLLITLFKLSELLMVFW